MWEGDQAESGLARADSAAHLGTNSRREAVATPSGRADRLAAAQAVGEPGNGPDTAQPQPPPRVPHRLPGPMYVVFPSLRHTHRSRHAANGLEGGGGGSHTPPGQATGQGLHRAAVSEVTDKTRMSARKMQKLPSFEPLYCNVYY